MKATRAVLLVFVAFLVPNVFCTDQEDENDVSIDNSNFTADLLKNLMEKYEGQNVFFSPVSLFSALGMIHAGAAGTSAEQIAHAFYYPEDEPDCICNASRLLIHSIQSIENVTVTMANKIYAEKKFKLRPEYLDDVERCFESQIEQINFTDKLQAVEAINSWVRNATNHKIDGIITPDSLPDSTLMMLLSGIYFKGSWGVKFKKELTATGTFFTSKKDIPSKIPMMQENGYYLYSEHAELESKVIAVPYKDENIFMVIILPNDRYSGLHNTVKKLRDYQMSQLTNKLYYEEVSLKMPRFKIESSMELHHVLDKLGITHLFTSLANLTKISEEKLQVSKVLQKAYIEVNEEGSEASAITGAITVPLTIGQQYEMTVDHPFIFAIWDKRFNSFLFAGAFVKPPITYDL